MRTLFGFQFQFQFLQGINSTPYQPEDMLNVLSMMVVLHRSLNRVKLNLINNQSSMHGKLDGFCIYAKTLDFGGEALAACHMTSYKSVHCRRASRRVG